MFARPPDDPRTRVELAFDGEPVEARRGDSIAAALLASGRVANRTTPVSGRSRGPWCLMGACQDCLVTVDGVPNVQGCMHAVAPGMRVETQRGARSLDADAAAPGALADPLTLAADASEEAARAAVDVAVIGAGPAGLAAATVAAECGLAVALYDDQRGPGGQIYRAIGASPLARPDALGADYWAGGALVRAFERSGAAHVAGVLVWSIAPGADGTLALAMSTGTPRAPASHVVHARAVVAATGAIERAMPVPGWTLPGAMSVGAAQILLKTAGIVPSRGTVIAGSGPLLWLYAHQCLEAGGAIDAILDTTPKGRLASALRHAGGFLVSRYLAKGWALVRSVRARVRVVEHVDSVAALGEDRVAGVRWSADGAFETLACDTLLLHQGVVPGVHLAGAAGAALAWDDAQACFAPVVDAWGGSTLPGLWIAGDAAGIAGADAAAPRGALAALAAANALGRFDAAERDRKARPHRAALERARRGRAFLDTLYRPADAFRVPVGDTIVCRCEEVTAERIASAARDGAMGPNQAKALTRCGMGPCQGRTCGGTACEIVAAARAIAPAEVGHARLRFPARPVTLGELASLPSSEAARRAVVRVDE